MSSRSDRGRTALWVARERVLHYAVRGDEEVIVLLIPAGLVGAKTGRPLADAAELLGAPMGPTQVPGEESWREVRRRTGAKRMADWTSS